MTQGLVSLLAFINIAFSSQPDFISPLADHLVIEQEEILASQALDLDNRDKKEFVNQVFKDNILLALYYLKGEEVKREVDWQKVKKPFSVEFVLQPAEAFAFHENILVEYKNGVVKTMGSRFLAKEGYRSSGWIIGDGVCHLASLINWVSFEAGLEVRAKVNHNFRSIPGIPREYGTSIRYSQSGHNSSNQNLYIKNNFDFPLVFRFEVKKEKVELKIIPGA